MGEARYLLPRLFYIYKIPLSAISNFYATLATIEEAARERALVMRAQPATDPHLLGIGTAVAVFLVLSLVKLGSFFIVHAGTVPRHVASDPAAARTASTVMR
ncbi:MAG: hypothetical protein JO255_04060 [Alphaproteobacteria bacterium]|nr:hypothetical protein [Alphaproteobacteria bacterium]